MVQGDPEAETCLLKDVIASDLFRSVLYFGCRLTEYVKIQALIAKPNPSISPQIVKNLARVRDLILEGFTIVPEIILHGAPFCGSLRTVSASGTSRAFIVLYPRKKA